MKRTVKKYSALLLMCIMALQLVGCSALESKNKKYARYVTSLLDANYKGQFETFISLTDSDEEAVTNVYNEGIAHLADALIAYYGIELVDDGTVQDQFLALTKNIYAASKYEVQSAVKSGDTYTVEVLVYPMDILQSTYNDVIAYIQSFNEKKEAGDFDEYEIEQYEVEFAQGILDILNSAVPNISYLEPASTIVTIQTDEDSYFISDDDFTKLDHNLIASVNDTSETAEEKVTPGTTTEAAPGIDDQE